MAKKLRKQFSRALKRRFESYEKDLNSCLDYHVAECGRQVHVSSQKMSEHFARLIKKVACIFFGFLVLFAVILSVCSCNVTRVVTTSSEYYQRGDTSCMIQTKTVESYDASKKL